MFMFMFIIYLIHPSIPTPISILPIIISSQDLVVVVVVVAAAVAAPVVDC